MSKNTTADSMEASIKAMKRVTAKVRRTVQKEMVEDYLKDRRVKEYEEQEGITLSDLQREHIANAWVSPTDEFLRREEKSFWERVEYYDRKYGPDDYLTSDPRRHLSLGERYFSYLADEVHYRGCEEKVTKRVAALYLNSSPKSKSAPNNDVIS